MGRPFSFITTPINLQGGPYEVLPNHELGKADADEISLVQETLDGVSNRMFAPLLRTRYESDPKIESETPRQATFIPLPEDQFRYVVLRFVGINKEIGRLQEVANLLDSPLTFGLTFTHPSGVIYNPHAFLEYALDHDWVYSPIPSLSGDDIKLLGELHALARSATARFGDLKRALQMFNASRVLLRNSDALVLANFSVIELALTHRPKAAAGADSISHQIRTKVPLLMNRFPGQLDIREHFGEADVEKMLTKLYDFRSRIAHGGECRWDRDLKILKSRKAACRLTKDLTKAVLRVALREPELLMDLRKC